ncbi:hypothetical protein ETAA8_43440 [Anatilimnocola aggregata]|uniref:Uncharacterized protein n=1 Tax=Anatilimnocola aggregata TaxID=2528021 RepID=A0A517YG71_9BACT|nr:hypothetical protein [Anatilimnocola aggregata]QDU29237.1 hypothetical protein ETAA8_43440 [Anatilimnocola aggregata]
MTTRVPLVFASVLLLLPLPYPGSYLALVIFYPLEEFDRRLRPQVWTSE